MKEYIIEQTTALFLQHGVKSVRMDDIASHLGVSKRTIYELFGDRESLILECVYYFYASQRQQHMHRVAPESNVVDVFIMLLKDWENMIAVNLNFMHDLERFYPVIFEKARRQAMQQGREQLKEKLQEGIGAGLFFPGLNLDFTTVALMSAINTVFDSPSVYEEVNVSMFDAFKYITMCFFRGISTEQGILTIDQMLSKHFPDGLFSQ